MNTDSMDPYGNALIDFYRGDMSALITTRRNDGFEAELPAAYFFREPADFSRIDRAATDLCRKNVLDIGAGAGCHSLVLQEKGLSVCAIDISPQACDVMRQRGVQEVHCANIFEFDEGQFRTLLMMGHGIGIVGNLAGLGRFLRHARKLVKPDSQIVLDSLDVRTTDDPRHLAYLEANRQGGRYVGEIRMQLEYRELQGPFFGWLHVDPETLTQHAADSGWSCEIVLQEDDGNYLARLRP